MLFMNGHGLYVWLSYGITLAVFLLNAWLAKSALTRNLGEVRDSAEESDTGRRPTVRQIK